MPYPKEGYHHPCQLLHRQVLPQTVLALRDNSWKTPDYKEDQENCLVSPFLPTIDWFIPNEMTFPYSLLIFFSFLFQNAMRFPKKNKTISYLPPIIHVQFDFARNCSTSAADCCARFFFLFEVTSNPWSYAHSANEVIDQPFLTRFARLIFQDFSTLSALVLFTIRPCHDKTLQQFILEEEEGRTYKCVVFTRILLNLPRRVFPK